MRACRSVDTGPFWGSATKRRPQARQRKVGVAAELGPLRTTWVAAQRGQVGTEVGSGFVVVILSV